VASKDRIVIHHGADNADVDGIEREVAVMRGYQDYHMRNGAIDIYYGVVIFPSGRAYVGRQGSPFTNNGGAYGTHHLGFGVCLPGNYMSKLPTPTALQKLVEVCRFGLTTFGLTPDRIMGHRDCGDLDYRNATNSCPGNSLYNYLPEIRRLTQISEEDSIMIPSPVQKSHVFPDIFQQQYKAVWLVTKNETAAPNKVTVVCTAGKAFKAIDTYTLAPWERVSKEIKPLIKAVGYGSEPAVSITVQTTEVSAAYVREL